MKGTTSRVLIALVPTTVVLALLFGVVRYGGVDGLRRRIYVEIAAPAPHPQFVPTPLPFDGEAATPASDAPSPRPSLPTNLPDLGAPQLTPVPAALSLRPVSPAPAGEQDSPVRPVVSTITPTLTPTDPAPSASQPTAEAETSSATQSLCLSGLTHIWQTWNNCGPATLAMDLSYFGHKESQEEVGSLLRPNPEDKNVNLEEMAAFARTRGLAAVVRTNGNGERLRGLLKAGVPVIIETWHEPEPNDGMGHYRLLVGFDDISGQWIAYDSYDARDLVKGQPYGGIRLPYHETDRLWSVFNRQYLVIYDAARAEPVERILAEDGDELDQWTRALACAQDGVLERPADPFAWFNLGSSLVALGRFEEAGQAYDRARHIGLPWRMLWYQFGPSKAYYETGRYDEVIALADATINTAKEVEEVYYWRGLAQSAQGDTAAARSSWQRAIELNPYYAEAAAALAALPGA